MHNSKVMTGATMPKAATLDPELAEIVEAVVVVVEACPLVEVVTGLLEWCLEEGEGEVVTVEETIVAFKVIVADSGLEDEEVRDGG